MFTVCEFKNARTIGTVLTGTGGWECDTREKRGVSGWGQQKEKKWKKTQTRGGNAGDG